MNIENNCKSIYNKICPDCGKPQMYSCVSSFNLSVRKNRKCNSCCKKGKLNPFYNKKHSEDFKRKMSERQTGEKNIKYWSGKKREVFSIESIKKMSLSAKKRFNNKIERKKLSISVKKSMHRTDVRKKHLDALHHSQWIKVRTDKGQLELLEKWNRLGFNFEPNFQVKTDQDLFYIDGYDKEKNVVLEYDSKYHKKLGQKQKDLIRQQKIIDILKPKSFWRYNFMTKRWKNVI